MEVYLMIYSTLLRIPLKPGFYTLEMMKNAKSGFWSQNLGFTENLGFLLRNPGFI